jgi:tetratricopeptide (TPR) repeat protein
MPGDYTTALTYLTNSLAIYQEIGDKAGEGTTLNNISQIYDAQGDYTTALTHLTNSLAIRQEIGDKAGESSTLFTHPQKKKLNLANHPFTPQKPHQPSNQTT